MINLANLTKKQIQAAFDNAGYSDVDFRTHSFKCTSVDRMGRPVSCYNITFFNDETGNVEPASLYVHLEQSDGKLYGEF